MSPLLKKYASDEDQLSNYRSISDHSLISKTTNPTSEITLSYCLIDTSMTCVFFTSLPPLTLPSLASHHQPQLLRFTCAQKLTYS